MNLITNLLQNKTDRYLRIDRYFNPMYSPDSLIKFLRSSSELKYLKKQLNTKTTNIFKIFKRLSVCSMLVIHSNKFYEFLNELVPMDSDNKWVNEQFIQPYYHFLKKICCSWEMFEQMKRHSPLSGDKNMELLFYDITLLKMVFVIVNKMPLLGRYYKDKNEVVTCNFINCLAVHAQRIYVSVRVLLCHIIQNAKAYLPTRQHQMIMKSILCDELPFINEEMKKLFLDKYFYPLSKGIGLKLFKPQEQSEQASKTINGIMNDHQDTNRQKQKYRLEVTLFPQPGRVNMMFYEQSLFATMRQVEQKGFEQQVEDIDIEQQEQQMNEQIVQYEQQQQQKSIDKKGKMSQNEIETGIERQVQSLKEIS